MKPKSLIVILVLLAGCVIAGVNVYTPHMPVATMVSNRFEVEQAPVALSPGVYVSIIHDRQTNKHYRLTDYRNRNLEGVTATLNPRP
jgi:hypothetical protein